MKPLERDLEKKLIAGVCAGIADSTGIDVTAVRVIFVIFALSVGFGFLLYIVLWVIMPIAPVKLVGAPKRAKGTVNEPPPSVAGRGRMVFGIVLIGAGIVVILSIFLHSFLPLVGIALIALGVIIITQIGMKR